MKKRYIYFWLCISLLVGFATWAKPIISIGEGEDVFYFANGSKFKGKLVKATEDKVTFNVTKGDRVIPNNFNRENVLVAFNTNGKYLVISSLSTDPATSQKQIDDYNNAPVRESGYDLLIKAVPMKVIPCKISYESDVIINFQTPTGGAGSINKSELVVVLYADGRHQFVMSPTEAGDLLKSATNDVDNYSKKPSDNAATQQSIPTTPTPSVPTPSPQSQPVVTQATNAPQLTEEERQDYKTKAIQRVEEFGNYLGIIADKSIAGSDRDKAIEEAAKLFLPDAVIEVSSANRGGTKKYKVKEYLTRVKLLPYSAIKVEWSEIQYVKDLKQEADGNYYGTLTGQQTFTGFGGKNGEDVMYSDKTAKNVKVKLQSYQKIINGQDAANWQLYLGNIGVATK